MVVQRNNNNAHSFPALLGGPCIENLAAGTQLLQCKQVASRSNHRRRAEAAVSRRYCCCRGLCIIHLLVVEGARDGTRTEYEQVELTETVRQV